MGRPTPTRHVCRRSGLKDMSYAIVHQNRYDRSTSSIFMWEWPSLDGPPAQTEKSGKTPRPRRQIYPRTSGKKIRRLQDLNLRGQRPMHGE
jgi:hypothetical protein